MCMFCIRLLNFKNGIQGIYKNLAVFTDDEKYINTNIFITNFYLPSYSQWMYVNLYLIILIV